MQYRACLISLISLLVAGCDASTNGVDGGNADSGAIDASSPDAGPPVDECADGCLVGGTCFPDGVLDPSNPCRICDADLAPTDFSDNDGGLCDDGAFCTSGDVCAAGACAGTPRACDDDIACNGVATCDEAAGACAAGTPTCATGEICDALGGACVLECSGCLIDSVCYGDGQVNALDPCQVCAVASSRTDWSDNDGATCDDGLFCTVNDTCSVGVCGSSEARECSDGVACDGVESCDEDANVCAAGTTTCATAEVCDVASDACVASCTGCVIDGVCYGAGQRNALNQCEVCEPGTSTTAWSNRTGACDDGAYCTDGDTCAAGACVPGAARDCGDAVSCNGTETCDESTDRCLPGTPTCGDGEVCDTITNSCELSCGGGTTECGTSCVDTTFDPGNCGSCGFTCGPAEACLDSDCVPLNSGCSALATFSYQIAPDLWICSYNALTEKTWPQTYGVCNESAGFHLATVGPMTRRGLPTDTQINAAMTAAAANGHDYITTGHPARSCGWDSAATDYEVCNGLGYVRVTDVTQTHANWVALSDGNTADFRPWPSANRTGAHPLGSLCMNASSDGVSVVFDHRWR